MPFWLLSCVGFFSFVFSCFFLFACQPIYLQKSFTNTQKNRNHFPINASIHNSMKEENTKPFLSFRWGNYLAFEITIVILNTIIEWSKKKHTHTCTRIKNKMHTQFNIFTWKMVLTDREEQVREKQWNWTEQNRIKKIYTREKGTKRKMQRMKSKQL